ncbi:MAG: DNA mismatch repair protein MutS, partial [bacterium]
TGPNMSGKSTFLRQTALIVLIAQIGSPVPARRARIGIIDRIFTRIGSSDNLSKNQSTFMVEMHEMAYILNNLSSRSLIILDEIGRGTSTYDGISIARAVIEYLHHKTPKPFVLFATHYFELTELSQSLPTVANYNVDVKEWQNKILFLHKIVPGSADRSYGVHVADLAGLPKDIIARAQVILQLLESHSEKNAPSLSNNTKTHAQMSFYDMTDPILDELHNLDINQLTPLSALQLLAEWKERS